MIWPESNLLISQSRIWKARGKDMGYVIKVELTHIIRSKADSPKLYAKKKLTTLSGLKRCQEFDGRRLLFN